MAMVCNIIIGMEGINVHATEESMVTIYFIDVTKEKWVENDSASMVLIDNTHNHKRYDMELIGKYTWCAEVPKSAENITFNRYNAKQTEQWNSWSAGGKDGNTVYLAQGSEYGKWTSEEAYGFKEGDTIYLDLREFKEWVDKEDATLYINFSGATKENNGGKNIDISKADSLQFEPYVGLEEIENYMYRYIVTYENSGKSNIRFWRGNNSTLWNCSNLLQYKDYINGYNCVKIKGWSDSGEKYLFEENSKMEINFNMSQYPYNELLEYYIVSEKLEKVIGTIETSLTIKNMKYEITGCNGEILQRGILINGAEWTIEEPKLVIGENIITVYVELKTGEKRSKKIKILNQSEENLRGIEMDNTDSDGDEISDYYEIYLGTNEYEKDTDDDGLWDSVEILQTGTSPLLIDTDANEIQDGEEDSDGDKLTNVQEINLGTYVNYEDSDDDGLLDGEEVNIYFTNPLNKDSDNDGLSDGEEIKLGLNPTNKDTDNDEILDGNEKFEQTYTQNIEESIVEEISVNLGCSGLIDNKILIEDTTGIDEKSSNVVGIIGCPVEIKSNIEFDSATITFKYDENLLSKTNENDLCIMWYDDKNDKYVMLEDSYVDVANNTVSYETTHFSTYLLVDQKIWLDNWREDINYRGDIQYYDLALLVDVSGSMWGDRIKMGIQTLTAFLDALYDKDRACIIKYDHKAELVQELTSDKELLKQAISSLYVNGGGTDADLALIEGVNQLVANAEKENKSTIVLICDGDVQYNKSIVERANANGITINCINVVDGTNTVMQQIANETNGNYYYAATTEELKEVMESLGHDINTVDTTDSDKDGLYDVYELNGMKLSNGQVVTTNPYDVDTDGDGISDYEEIGAPSYEIISVGTINYSCTLFHYTSDPTKDQRLDGYILTNSMSYLPTNSKKYNEVNIDLAYEDGRKTKIAYDRNGNEIYGAKNMHGTLDCPDDFEKEEQVWRIKALALVGKLIGKDGAAMFTNYLDGSGEDYYYDATELLHDGTLRHEYYRKNMKKLLQTCENYLEDGEKIYIANAPSNALVGFESIDTDFLSSILHAATFISINAADAGIIAEVIRDGDTYTIKYKYYLIDFYDYDIDKEEELYYMNRYGFCRTFMNYGVYEEEFSWDVGGIDKALDKEEIKIINK